jgi:hypothetical protein
MSQASMIAAAGEGGKIDRVEAEHAGRVVTVW